MFKYIKIKKIGKIIFFNTLFLSISSYMFKNYLSLLCVGAFIVYNRRVLSEAREASRSEYSWTGALIVTMFILFIIANSIRYLLYYA